ncbi:MAG: HlyC/CorC family transporter [Deltaproteobacteria bacterium]|nr:HlyC/CorC family transporter [Deltaproteobacteria bacterium]MBW2658978.1 HlyC/CorC family transporter [Deltaproteobacteria bacterium]
MVQTLFISVTLAITVSAICSICEAVLYSISASQVEMMKKTNHQIATHLQKLRADIEEPITAILTLNTISHTIGASVAGAAAVKLFGDQNLILFSIVFTLGILIFSEILPKTIGVTYAYKLAPVVTYPLQWMVFILKPIVWLCRSITRLLPQKKEDSISAEEIQTIAALSLESGDIEEDEEEVIKNIIELKNRRVRQVMTPRTVTFSLDEDITVEKAMTMVTRLSSHSRIPIFKEEPNNVTGMIMRKDILQAAAEGKRNLKLSNYIRPVHFVPETAPLNKVLADFFERRQHLFVVVDEYGTVTGILSMEDILEEIVGREIVDESDKTKDMRELARSKNLKTQQILPQNEGESSSE